ncbi:MAG: AAA family ATPase [Spirochaetaceae bacterium]|nr:AAA family ATPase [Spirochaetaceae bacterium]
MSFSWIPFYKELAEKLLDYKNRRNELVDFIYAEDGLKDFSNALHLENKEQKIDDIDPFSIFGLFNSGKKKEETRIAILEKIKKYFNISAALPSDFDGIPVLNYARSFFYDWNDLHNSCNELWDCYEEFVKNNSPEKYINFRNIKVRPAESTMPLFWIRPYDYIALDSNNRDYLKLNGMNADNIKSCDEYVYFVGQLKQKLGSNDIKEETIADFSYNAWSMEKEDINYWLIAPGENAWDWDAQKNEGIIAIGWGDLGDLSYYENDYETFLADFKTEFKDGDKDKSISARQVWNFYNGIKIGDIVFARRGLYQIIGMGKITSDYYYDESRRHYTNVRKVDWQKIGEWNYPGQSTRNTVHKLKSEQAMEIIKTMNEQENEKTISLMNLLEVNKNLILHGAPGTGKTYTAKDIAAQMICGKTFSEIESGSEEEKLFNEQTEFVQFHPSYDYSDFVEGLRPIEGENTGDVGFERKDGVFKEFCGKALKSGSVIQTNNFDESWNNLIEYIRNEMSEGRLVKIGNWEYSVSKADSLKYQSVGTKSNYSFTITKDNVYLAYQHKKGRPSGYFQKEMEDTVAFMQENFRLAPFSENSISPQKNTKLPYIFIIDEINRGEMSKIFGELFFSIDPDYRGTKGKVRTQYANMLDEQNDFDDALGITSSFGHFFVPENVYIIGTMNDIDRSVDSMDFAMRRRFTFVELKANECLGMLNNLEFSEGISKSDILSKMTVLNEEIEKISGLSSAYHIGGSYFAKLSKYSDKSKSEAFECLWNNHLKPLITDYLRGLPNLEAKLATFKKKYDAAGVVSEESDN